MSRLDEIRAKRAEAKQTEKEKIIFKDAPMPAKFYGDERDNPDHVAKTNSPDNGEIPGKVYKDNEIDPAFAVKPALNPAADKLNGDFEREMRKIGIEVATAQDPEVAKMETKQRTLKDRVDKILDKYLDDEELLSAKLFCEAVQYEERFVKPILLERQTFFRELEDMGFVQIALMIKGWER